MPASSDVPEASTDGAEGGVTAPHLGAGGQMQLGPAAEFLQLTPLAPASDAGRSVPVMAAEYGYLPRPLLSKGPQAISPIWLDWPEGADRASRYEAVLALFIDEHGVVQSTRLDQGDLPDALLERARRAFLGARFWPGELDGKPVRSRLSVELLFEQDRIDIRLNGQR